MDIILFHCITMIEIVAQVAVSVWMFASDTFLPDGSYMCGFQFVVRKLNNCNDRSSPVKKIMKLSIANIASRVVRRFIHKISKL